MQKDPSEELWKELIRQSLEDEKGPDLGSAVKKHLSEGRPVYYSEDSFPGETIKHYPDGHREIVTQDEAYRRILAKKLPEWLVKACPELESPR